MQRITHTHTHTHVRGVGYGHSHPSCRTSVCSYHKVSFPSHIQAVLWLFELSGFDKPRRHSFAASTTHLERRMEMEMEVVMETEMPMMVWEGWVKAMG